MQTEKRKAGKDILTPIIAVLTFLILLAFQINYNFKLNVPHSNPDELGAMLVSSGLGGYDWNPIFEKSGLYYGFGTALPFFFLFKLISDPIILYRAFLAVGCLWRTLPVFVIFPIAKRYFGIKNPLIIAAMAAAAVLGTPTRGTAIDNEPMLILTGWLSFYLLIRLFDAKKAAGRIISLVLLAATLGYGFTAHQRAFITVIAAVIAIAIFFIKPGKNTRRTVIITAAAFVTVIGLMIALLYILSGVLSSGEGEIMNNTLASVIVGIPDKISEFFSPEGLVNFLSLVASNFWGISVYFCGVAGVCVVAVFARLGRRKKAADINSEAISDVTQERLTTGNMDKPLNIASLYPVLVLLISLIGLGFLWNYAPRPTIDNGEELSRGYFYLRYIGNTLGICLFVGMGYMLRYGFKGAHLAINLLATLLAFRFTFVMSLQKAFANDNYQGDLFGFFTPLSFSGEDIYYNGKGLMYYMLPTIISTGVILLIFLLSKFRAKVLIPVILMAIMAYQYAYLSISKDRRSADIFYSYADSLYELKTEYPEAFEDAKVHYCCTNQGLDVNSQIILGTTTLDPSFPTEAQENMVLLTDSEYFFNKNIEIDMSGFDIYSLDDNEIIYTNKEDLKEAIEEYLWEKKGVDKSNQYKTNPDKNDPNKKKSDKNN